MFGYMAPEQVRGLGVDHRADIFAFGAALYEMLSGRREFCGETASDTKTGILTSDTPDLDSERLAIPLSLDRIGRRCVEKSPDLRFQSAMELPFALDGGKWIDGIFGRAGGCCPARRTRASWLPWTVAIGGRE